MGCLFSKGNELFRNVMNSSSKLPPTGLLLRPRVIGQEQKRELALASVMLSSLSGGGLGLEAEDDYLGWIFYLQWEGQGQKEKQSSFPGQTCRRSQRPSVEESLLQREGSFPGVLQGD